MPRMTTRDYKRTSRSSSVSKLKEFGLGVIVGAVLASAAFLIAGAHARHRAAAHSRSHGSTDSHGTQSRAPAKASSNSSGATASPGSDASPRAAHAASQPLQYDFYKMLPRFNVPVPHEDGHSQHEPMAAVSPQSHAPAAASYVLQVGAYRSSAEADQVRARLAREGISAVVDRVAEGATVWNRVRIGPLGDADLARVREQLRTANIHPLVIREYR